jgi:hypothetical protein
MINTSPMLTAKEKEEWLDMLIVMNDKQVSELEAILNTPTDNLAPLPPAPPAPAPTAPTPRSSTPPLSHISNLPSSMSQVIPAAPALSPRYPLPKPTKPGSLKQWENNLRHTVEEKELARPQEEKLLSGTRPAVKPEPRPMPKQAALTPLPTVAPRAVPEKPGTPANLAEPKDAAALTLGNMRAMGNNLITALKQVVASSNYYEVLFYLEKSPLYQLYLETGREALSAGASAFPASAGGKNLLSKAEFEAFSDLLKSIQIS